MSATPPYGIRPPRYRLPEETRLGRVRLQVSDLARSLDYYEQVLGLRSLQRSGAGAVLSAHDDDNPIVELCEDRGVHPVPHEGRLGLYHFAILLPARDALGRFLGHLSEINERVGMSDHYVSEAIYLQDPDNLGIEVYADRPRTMWQYHDGQLAMTTIPLNVRDVLAAADGTPWTGLPSGTRIGHVHLHVSGIDDAAAFYHEGIGFDKVVWSYPGALFMSAGGYHHHLGTNTWARGVPSASTREARLLDWEIVVPAPADVTDVVGNLELGGREVTRSDDGSISAQDPWGTRVRVVAARS